MTNRDKLHISLLDSLSHNLYDSNPNDWHSFAHMVKTDHDLDDDVIDRILGNPEKKAKGITDPFKRATAFVIEKLEAVLGKEFKDISEGYVRAWQYKFDPRQNCNFKSTFPTTVTTYLWRDESLVKRMLCVRGEWREDWVSSSNFRQFAAPSYQLADLTSRLVFWEKMGLDEPLMVYDLKNAFPLKEFPTPLFRTPLRERSSPNIVYEGELSYTAERDIFGKPVLLSTTRSFLEAKRAKVSVQFYDYGKTLAVKVAYIPA